MANGAVGGKILGAGGGGYFMFFVPPVPPLSADAALDAKGLRCARIAFRGGRPAVLETRCARALSAQAAADAITRPTTKDRLTGSCNFNQPGGHNPDRQSHVGAVSPCYVIAEVGNNHNGDFDRAIALVDAAVAAGADCAKFQMRKLDEVYRASSLSGKDDDLAVEYTLDLLAPLRTDHRAAAPRGGLLRLEEHPVPLHALGSRPASQRWRRSGFRPTRSPPPT